MLSLFRTHASLSSAHKVVLALLPFLFVILIYLMASDARLIVNPDDKLLPSATKMVESTIRMASQPDLRTGNYLLWSDTLASLTRLLLGIFLGSLVGLMVGLSTSIFPVMRAISGPFLTFLSIVPPLTILPILFIALGVGETSKIALIFLGTVFVISRDLQLYIAHLPGEQITKALSLGARPSSIPVRILLPQVMPRLLDTTRLTLGAAWLFLIAAEMISATDGLGYRIGLVRRYLAMDVIIPYVLWITFLGFVMDWFLRISVKSFFPWYETQR